jgi:hypothetical protein
MPGLGLKSMSVDLILIDAEDFQNITWIRVHRT